MKLNAFRADVIAFVGMQMRHFLGLKLTHQAKFLARILFRMNDIFRH